ncbi:MarR family transcriptional regulator [Mycobacterium sp. Lab-001]|uniref:MarR family transcriptional regulator n=1 Tax=Mycobacterium sp. Lab-001 TaxID=3410136 RepID=UPI003D16C708
MTAELKVLQALRLKGRIAVVDIAGAVDEDPVAVNETVVRLVDSGLLLADRTVRLSQEGRARLQELLAVERQGADRRAIGVAYGDFRSLNRDFKELVSDWQLRDGQPNSHDDSGYDAAVLERLDGVHRRVVPIIAAVSEQLPRLSAYADRLGAAYAKVRRGETMWLTRPLIDSYHTVWFELHEELIGAAGLTRDGEARAGHAE